MKSLKSSSIFTANNSVLLIIFVFIFIAVGMFFLIRKTTEKEKQNKADEMNRKIEENKEENMEVNNGSKNSGVENINNMDSSESFNTDYNTVSETFSDEVGLFIKKDSGPNGPELYLIVTSAADGEKYETPNTIDDE